MEVAVTTGAVRRAKLQSNHHQQQTNIQFFTGRMSFPGKGRKGKYHILCTCLPQAHLGDFQLCLWPILSPGYLGGGLPWLLSALWCQYHVTLASSIKRYSLWQKQLTKRPTFCISELPIRLIWFNQVYSGPDLWSYHQSKMEFISKTEDRIERLSSFQQFMLTRV